MSEQWGHWQSPPAEQPVAESESAVDLGERRDEPEPVVDVQEPETEDDSDPAASSVYALRQRLTELEELPIEEHPARYEQLHAELTAALGRIDGGA